LLTSVRNVPARMVLTRTEGPSACVSPTVTAFRPALAAAYGMMSARGADRPGAADVDDRPAARRRHPYADEHREPERALEVDGDDLVEQFLADRVDAVVQRGHPGIVDRNVDPPEAVVGGADEAVEPVPAADVDAVRQRRPPGSGGSLGGGLLARLQRA